MRENLFRGKKCNGAWTYGYYVQADYSWHDYGKHKEWIVCSACANGGWFALQEKHAVIPETVGQYAELPDKNGKMIFEGDIVKYSTFDGFDCRSIVKFGKYKQDGSGGEYKASDCLGFYVEVDKFTCPDWCDEPEMFHDYLKQQSLAEIVSQCEIIGNIYDNPELEV